MLETFTNAINELAFCIGYTMIVLAIIYTGGKIIYMLIRHHNKNKE